MINEAVKVEVQMQFAAKSTGIWNSIQRQVKRAAIAQIMHETRNNQSEAAKAPGINRAGTVQHGTSQGKTKAADTATTRGGKLHAKQWDLEWALLDGSTH